MGDVIRDNQFLNNLYADQYGMGAAPKFNYAPGPKLSTNVYDAMRYGPMVHGYDAPGAPNYAAPGDPIASQEEYQAALKALSGMLPQQTYKGF
jgi:hypothetical protein